MTQANFGAGNAVVSVTVNSATTATAVINIDPAATTGPRTVTVTTGAEVASLTNGFSITARDSGDHEGHSEYGSARSNRTLSVSISGQFTQWVQGTTTATLGAGITIES